jgi:hypothetical protein
MHAHKAWTVAAHERFLGIRLLQRIIRVAVPVLQTGRKLDRGIAQGSRSQLFGPLGCLNETLQRRIEDLIRRSRQRYDLLGSYGPVHAEALKRFESVQL